MATVYDVANYILKKTGPITAMKLQKLVYYCQAWSLVWEERPIFRARVEAWANGPVVPELYKSHQGQFKISGFPKGNSASLSSNDRTTIDAVLGFYANHSSQWLSDLTHSEDPWKNARQGIPAGAACKNEISQAAMAEYYGGL